jgi:AraC-like DNA-binding protein
VAQAILQNPAESKPMAALCAEAGVSVRTIERVIRREIGSSFESWRRQVRLTRAVELLVSGYSIKEVAHRIGYRRPSAFVEMFRRIFGTTPKAWISALENLGQGHPAGRSSCPLPAPNTSDSSCSCDHYGHSSAVQSIFSSPKEFRNSLEFEAVTKLPISQIL